eukprot:TRINITY_DN7550_c0_g1_i4.p1 TRINITY_DN7550_c0_g1~~TRINITY_DN7550_c0_g1_i4.p1  ORF type:complete len:234 (-),score=70.48 TRINITY_DN7550_c0_g1_i4:553-1254(-)
MEEALSLQEIDQLAEFLFDDDTTNAIPLRITTETSEAMISEVSLKRGRENETLSGPTELMTELPTDMDRDGSNSGEDDSSRKKPKVATKERNREAAAKSRKKKEDKLKTLEAQVQELQQDVTVLRTDNVQMTTENTSLKAQVANLSELLFRIASNVSSDDVKKVALGVVSSLACASGGQLLATGDVGSLPLHTILVGRRSSSAVSEWCALVPGVGAHCGHLGCAGAGCPGYHC